MSQQHEWPDVAEDDPDVVIAAHAIAEHGIGRPWDDFLPTDIYGVDHADLIEYARVAVAALRAQTSPAIELVYGLLWLAPTDASSKQGRCVLQARAALREQLDRDARLRGVNAAMLALHAAPAAEPQTVRCERDTAHDAYGRCNACNAAIAAPCGFARLQPGGKPRTNPRTHLGIMANGLNGKD